MDRMFFTQRKILMYDIFFIYIYKKAQIITKVSALREMVFLKEKI